MGKKALEGTRIIDLSRFVSGPFCAQLLGDLGAEVIKIEKGAGDDTRRFGPFVGEHCVYYAFVNRNKKDLKVDYRKPEGMQVLKDLIRESDALIENFIPGTLEKMGLGREELNKINPKIHVTHISGFGQTGPFRSRPAFDCISQAMSGIMSVTGKIGSNEPYMIGTVYHDYIAGTFGALSTVAALYHSRVHRDDSGQEIDIAMLDSSLAYSLFATQDYILSGTIMEKHGNRDPSLAPATTFKAKDGKYVLIHCGRDPHFVKLMQHIGRTDVLEDERFNTAPARMANQDAIEKVVQQWVSTKNAYDVENELAKLVLPCAVVADFGDVVNNPHVQERGILRTLEYPDGTKMPTTGPIIKMSETPCEIHSLPPELGQHTEEILRDILKYPESKILELKEMAVI